MNEAFLIFQRMIARADVVRPGSGITSTIAYLLQVPHSAFRQFLVPNFP
jgi:hypothetical protein